MAASHRYVHDPTEGWCIYYHDLMTGRVWEPAYGVYTGIPCGAWEGGSPIADAQTRTDPTEFRFTSIDTNPSRGVLTFRLSVPARSAVRVEVFSVSGRRLRRLLTETREAGESILQWDGKDGGNDRQAGSISSERSEGARELCGGCLL
jgi:hypothetical protein